MRRWSLPPEAPLSLGLAADARLTSPDYLDDQIWELALGEGDPPALAVRTTYGLRAHSMRLFPSFSWRGQLLTDPSSFSSQPTFEVMLPNYMRIRLQPFHDLEVMAEYWVVDSHSLVGRLSLENAAQEPGDHRLRLHALLQPDEGGSAMSERHMEGASVLVGESGGLRPLVFLGGGAVAETAMLPALAVRHRLQPGELQQVFWAHIGTSDPRGGLAVARDLAGGDWEAMVARLERTNDRWIQVETGDPEWDAALAASQQVALRSLVGSTRLLPHDSFVLRRTTSDGHSESGDGRDYEAEWSGQDPMAAYHLGKILLPIAPHRVKGWIRNFIYIQEANGEIDSRPGLAGQRAGTLCPPLLGSLAWEVFRATEDDEFLREVFDPLFEFLQAWFAARHDRDQDGVPEWDNPLHAGYPDSPTFVRWGDWGEGLDIRFSESPDLVAYLLREVRALVDIAQIIGRSEALPELEARATALRRGLERAWDESAGTYRHVDRDLHYSAEGRLLGEGQGDCSIEVEEAFDPMVRLVVRVRGPEGKAQKLHVTVHGRGSGGKFSTERLDREAFQWFWEFGTATTEHTFARIERIEVRGAGSEFSTEVRTANFQRRDLTLLLPLWSHGSEGKRAERAIQEALLEPGLYWRAFGLSSCSAGDPAYDPQNRSDASGVRMFWNHMLGQALLGHGRREEAAQLVENLMSAAIGSLREEKAFRAIYDPDRPAGYGARDSVWGLAPVRLFLDVLGVRLISPWKIVLAGENPYPWPVRVAWRGLTVERPLQGASVVRFPDQHEVRVEDPAEQVIERIR